MNSLYGLLILPFSVIVQFEISKNPHLKHSTLYGLIVALIMNVSFITMIGMI